MFDTILHRILRVPYRLHVTKFRSPKKPKATIVLLHGIGTSAEAWNELVPLLPDSVRVIGVDLLGFGNSPRPRWAVYNASTQARAVLLTLASLNLTQKPILVGHSMGSLVAIEMAKRYPLLMRQLVLCSPPLYMPIATKTMRDIRRDDVLRMLYRTARKSPERLARLSPLIVRLGFANKAFDVTDTRVDAYMSALEANIINQTSIKDIERIKTPIRILYGAFDAVVIGKNIKTIATVRDNVTARRLMVGHEVVGPYTKAVAKELESIVLN
jgi:pimeloyl-ACP methyl ester carboxylesterase